MADSRSAMLSSSEVQQLFQSVQSRSIREVALTVCTIRGLATEVKTILRDLFHDEVPAPMPSPDQAAFGVLGIQSHTSFPQISGITSAMPTLSAPQPFGTLQRTGFGRLLAKRGRRRHRCSHCPRTFSAQSSVWRHVKSHHNIRSTLPNPPSLTAGTSTITAGSLGTLPVPTNAANSSVKSQADVESPLSNDTGSNSFNLPDTSVVTPREIPISLDDSINIVAVVSPLASSQHAPSPDGYLSPMPTIADMFNAECIKPEPNDEIKMSPMEHDGEIEIDSPMKSQEYSAEADMSHSMSMLFPSSVTMSSDNETQIRASVDAQLMEIPLDGMFQCSDCGWRSKSAESMRAHMLSHKGILPFSCDICNYKTNKKHVLTRHYTIHTGEKPHKCPICSFGSLDHVELLKHMTKTHPGVHPFTCTICGHHATTNTLLKKHMKVGHSMSARKQQSPSSSKGPTTSEAHSLSGSSGMGMVAKVAKPRNVLNSASETIYASATTSVNQPVFP